MTSLYYCISPPQNLNKLNAAPGDDTFITAAEIRGLEEDKAIARTPDYTFWLDFDFYEKDNEMFHHEEHYPFHGGESEGDDDDDDDDDERFVVRPPNR